MSALQKTLFFVIKDLLKKLPIDNCPFSRYIFLMTPRRRMAARKSIPLGKRPGGTYGY
jgi:hypothetical protein